MALKRKTTPCKNRRMQLKLIPTLMFLGASYQGKGEESVDSGILTGQQAMTNSCKSDPQNPVHIPDFPTAHEVAGLLLNRQVTRIGCRIKEIYDLVLH